MSGERILVVEDESILAVLIKSKLQNWGYIVVDWVDTGEDAIERALETEPDLILMDIVLKGKLDGIEAAQQIRSNLDIPIIYLTAYSDQEVLKRARVTEPYGYILKPFREGDVKANIEMVLHKHESEKIERENIKKSVLADFYDLVQILRNSNAAFSDEEIKSALLDIFAKRLARDLPTFARELDKLGLNYPSDDFEIIFDTYLSWVSELLSAFGITSKIAAGKDGCYIEFLNCPWEDQAKNKPIFCLNCQAIINHSLDWAPIKGNLDRNKTIAEGHPSCIFKLN